MTELDELLMIRHLERQQIPMKGFEDIVTRQIMEYDEEEKTFFKRYGYGATLKDYKEWLDETN